MHPPRSQMPSIEVGKLISKQRWEAAAKVALRVPSHSCSPPEKEAKKAFRHGDLHEALQKMPQYCHDERVLLQSLLAGMAHKAAVLSMPHAKLFKLAYWSRVWNLMASERARCYSMRHAVAGNHPAPDPPASSLQSFNPPPTLYHHLLTPHSPPIHHPPSTLRILRTTIHISTSNIPTHPLPSLSLSPSLPCSAPCPHSN